MPPMQELSSLDGWVTRLLVPYIFVKKNSINFQKIPTKISFHGEKKKTFSNLYEINSGTGVLLLIVASSE